MYNAYPKFQFKNWWKFSQMMIKLSHLFIYLLIYALYILPACANTSAQSAGSRIWCLGPLLGFLAVPHIVLLLSNAKSANHRG